MVQSLLGLCVNAGGGLRKGVHHNERRSAGGEHPGKSVCGGGQAKGLPTSAATVAAAVGQVFAVAEGHYLRGITLAAAVAAVAAAAVAAALAVAVAAGAAVTTEVACCGGDRCL